MTGDDKRAELRRQGRIAALVIAASGLLAILAPVLVYLLRLPARFEILIYLFSLAGFTWALIVTFQIWRKGQSD